MYNNKRDIVQEWKEKAAEVDALLGRMLPVAKGPAATVLAAMEYAVRGGGKRLRPVLVLEAARLFGGEDPSVRRLAEPFAAAIEMIHTYSLVHDDLPDMDNDDFRRGSPTVHRVYGNAMGILAGDGLLNLAYETASQAVVAGMDKAAGPGLDLGLRAAEALRLLAVRPGVSGMLGGQVMDIELGQGGGQVTEEALTAMYGWKTGALISCAMEMGCVLGGGSREEQSEMAEIARLAGLAFQIQDDILDVAGDEEKLGKPLHSDEKNQKTTFATLLGLPGAAERVKALSDEAVARMERVEWQHIEYDGFLSGLLAALAGRDK